ncbi:MAG: zinc ribbon domain-containing protein [Candidatus Bathyarchaeota archaeon]|nr:MAG: zinc ribbon domain-containing protein [Candidatus Bathyarchaeota archaeon]
MVRKGLAVWILGSSTFLAGLHVLDGFLWLVGVENVSWLLSVYPSVGPFVPMNLSPIFYLLCSLVAVFLLWGATATVAMRSPIEAFLGKVLEDGKKENQADVEFLEAKTSILEMMSETLENNSKSLAGLRDLIFNVRREVLSFEAAKKGLDDLKGDVEYLKKMMKGLEKEIKKHKLCPACGREVMAEFRVCPYCGENLLKPAVGGGAVMLAALPLSKDRSK